MAGNRKDADGATALSALQQRGFLLGCKLARTVVPWASKQEIVPRDLLNREAGMSIRPVKRLIKAKPTMEGAGVHLRRAFGFGNTSEFDPFLLLDDFRNDVPEDYLKGFPWHPHRVH
jgi:hypothetical protein